MVQFNVKKEVIQMAKKNEATNTTPVDTIDTELQALTTVSSKIRFLLAKGWKRGAIAKKLNKRYQHVRNVELQPLKKQA
jgi:DNA-binding NarL/FixJ family response regulator